MFLVDLLARVAGDVLTTLATTWPFLLLSVVGAAALNVYVGAERLSGWLERRTGRAVVGAVLLATVTPFCSCGTTAVALGMIASRTPWAPIVAFLVASPLTSPSELVLSAGLLGWPFALVFFGGTIVLGLAAGALTMVVERTGWLAGQARMATACGASSCEEPAIGAGTWPTGGTALADGPTSSSASPGGATSGGATSGGATSGSATAVTAPPTMRRPPMRRRLRWDELVQELAVSGRRLAVYFLGFTALSYLVIEAVPTTALQSLLGGSSFTAIVVAALVGVPAYLNTEGSLPMLAGLVGAGMSPGPAMAFLVTGAGTSVGAVAGMLVIARRRVVVLTVGILVVGALGLGVLAQVLLG